MEECWNCGAKFDIKFDDPEDHELNFRPRLPIGLLHTQDKS